MSQPGKSQASQAGEEASSAASSTSKPGASPYVGPAGPGFDPGKPPEHQVPEEQPDGEQLLEQWEEEQVRSWLENAGGVAHATLGVGELDWAMTKADLDRIGPPLTRILNRYQPTRAVAAYSDPAAVAMGFGLYGWRSALERTAVLKARKAAEDGEGRAAPTTAGEAVAAPPPPVDGDGPAIADGYVPLADQLRATRPEEAQ